MKRRKYILEYFINISFLKKTPFQTKAAESYREHLFSFYLMRKLYKTGST